VAHASGQPLDAILAFMGLRDLENLLGYVSTTTEEVTALGEFLREHWLRVMRGEKPEFIICLTQAVQAIRKFQQECTDKLSSENSKLREFNTALQAQVQHLVQLAHTNRSATEEVRQQNVELRQILTALLHLVQRGSGLQLSPVEYIPAVVTKASRVPEQLEFTAA
jgi:hypothetical protein